MAQFDRIALVTVGRPGDIGQEITANRIAFRVVKTDTPKTNSMLVSCWNLSASTRALFEDTQNRIALTCGYVGEALQQVAVGNISRGITEYRHPDVIVNAECGDGLVTYRDSRVTLSYASSVSTRQVIEDISRAMGLPIRPTDANLSGAYTSGWAFVGPARSALDQVAERFRLEWSIQSEELQITNRRQPATSEVILIAPDTGMIGSPEKLDNLSTNLTGDKEQPGVAVSVLLNPAIEPGVQIAIQARNFDQTQYRVRSVEHQGDTRGYEWLTRVEVVAL
jgi:hypothetical protein